MSERRTNSFYVNDGETTLEVSEDELEEYEYAGWARGKLNNTRWMNNGRREAMVHVDEIEKRLKEGWKRGRLQKKVKSSTTTQPSDTDSTS